MSLSDAVATIDATMNRIGVPATIRGTFQGTAKAFQDSLANQPFLILAALVTIYIVLGVLYESYVHPLTILSTLPSAGVGALLALMAFNTEFSIMALIGVILLIGIVKKNAIMMIDFALEAERSRGLSSYDAIYEACLLRFRPIMMTTMAALLGALPLAIGIGDGGELRQPLGIAIVGGLILSQVLTLYSTPVIYLYLDRFRLWSQRLRAARRRAPRCNPANRCQQQPSISDLALNRAPCHAGARRGLFGGRGDAARHLAASSNRCPMSDDACPSTSSAPAPGRRPLAPLLAILLLAPGLSGCILGSEQPELNLEVPGAYREGVKHSPDAAVPALDWWRGFRSNELTALMEEAQIFNLDIAVAAAQIIQADAQVGVSGAPLLPSVTGTVNAEQEHFGSQTGSTNSLITGATGSNGSNISQYSSGLTASYMLDFWGKNRATLYAAEENATVSRYNREVVTLTTIVTVANTYFQVLAAQDELRVARRNLAAAERILTLIKQQFAGGTASQLDLSQQEALVSTERAAIPPLEVTLRQNIAALAVLVARAPANFNVNGGTLTSIAVPRVTPGLPSELLYQRPDIRQAEAQLASSNFSVESARAAFFPQIQLTATTGVQSAALAALFGPGAWYYTLAAGLTQPLFDGYPAGKPVEAGQGRATAKSAGLSQGGAVGLRRCREGAGRAVADHLAGTAADRGGRPIRKKPSTSRRRSCAPAPSI